jgi:pantetheine-phosphate adenylyltransferase
VLKSEMAQAQTNLAVSGVHTLFLPSQSKYSYISSKYVREIARFGGDVSMMVPESASKRLKDRFTK